MTALLPDPIMWAVIGVTGAAILTLLVMAGLIVALIIQEARS